MPTPLTGSLTASLTVVALNLSAGLAPLATDERPAPAVFHASQSGRPTMDLGEGGGNPFASALVELLGRPSLSQGAFPGELSRLTERRSLGFQQVDGPPTLPHPSWSWTPVPDPPGRVEGRRLALIVVYSDYRGTGASSLPGAERDRRRLTQAFHRAGFVVTSLANPSRAELQQALQRLAWRSRSAEAAAIYLTGHGFEHRGEVFVMPNDGPLRQGAGMVPGRAITVSTLTRQLHASRSNLVFFGGCRTRW